MGKRLGKKQKEAIRKMHWAGKKHSTIAKKYGISKRRVRKVAIGY